MYDAPHQTKLGYVRDADDFVMLVNGPKQETIASKNKVQGQ
jgi:hypothetical protein